MATEKQPSTTAERQRTFRLKRLADGLVEVRGIFLPVALHAKLKAYAQRLLKGKP